MAAKGGPPSDIIYLILVDYENYEISEKLQKMVMHWSEGAAAGKKILQKE